MLVPGRINVMLIVRNTFAKILPESMHSRWDTWSSVWLPQPILPTLTASFAATLISSPIQSTIPGVQGALCCAGIFGLNASIIAFSKRGRKEWTLPHEQWKTACAKVEEKMRGIVHMPHMYRMGALCDLSYVLKDAEMERLAAAAKQLKALGLPTDKNITTGWMEGYRSGNMSAQMLNPEMLRDVHTWLGFTELDIDQWVEASYIQRVHSDLNKPMPGTVDALAKMANENPASMAFYLQKYPAYTERKKIYDSSFVVQWGNDASSAWFQKTHWPKTVELMHELHANMSTEEVPVPSAMALYKQIMNAKNAQILLGVDGDVFDMDALTR